MQFNPVNQITNGITSSTKQTVDNIEKKSTYPTTWPWLINGGDSGDNNTITIKRALKFYDDAAPVATAIDWINDEFKTLSLTLKNDTEFDNNAEILRFLRTPNDDMTQEDFLETMGAYFLITNECYLLATGDPNKEPAEVLVISPEHVVVRKGEDGFINQMRIQAGSVQEVFNRDEKSYRFYNRERTRELWQIKGFSAIGDSVAISNTISSSELGASRGRSKLSSIHREINQYIQIATSNLSTLNNGMKPSGVLSVPDGVGLDESQFNRLKDQVENYYSSAQNSGKVLILDNGMIFTPASLSAKDMDFKELSKSVTITIFNRYKVPLPLISSENMTLANMETAKINLYDNCVIPLAHRLLRELTNFLGPRFKLKEDMLITADISKIPAMQVRHFQQLKIKKELDVLTDNEIREELGVDEINGGDVLYKPANLIPVTSSIETNDTNTESPNNDDMKSVRPEFFKLMQSQVDKKGNRLLTDEEIKEIADSEGL